MELAMFTYDKSTTNFKVNQIYCCCLVIIQPKVNLHHKPTDRHVQQHSYITYGSLVYRLLKYIC